MKTKNQLPVPTCTEVNYQVQVAVRIGVYVEAINQLKELSIVFNVENILLSWTVNKLANVHFLTPLQTTAILQLFEVSCMVCQPSCKRGM